jgi:alkanesulfonate monooxygenase SsuD/methylene tetrahydromethanopterin reductase-like flavin-dependent oxidoreductase (luciferase family)
MKLGVFMMPLHPPEKSRTVCFEEDIELVERVDALGFSEAWVGQHLTLEWEPIPSNDIFIATVIPRTKNIHLGTGVTIVPQHHPVNVAVRLAMLDHLAHGRFSCGFGQGGVPTDWELFDLPDGKTQGLMTVEGIDMVVKLWTTEPPFDFKGDFWHIKVENPMPDLNMGRILRPYQKPHPQIAMSIVKGTSMAARMAGQRGYKPLSTSLVPFDTVAEHWKTYSAGAADAKLHEPNRALWSISRTVFVADSDDEAMDFALNSALGRSYTYLLKLLAQTNMTSLVKHDAAVPDSAVNAEYMLKHASIIGSPKRCIQRLEELWETTGGFGTLLMIAHDWDDKDKWIKSMDYLTNTVGPKLPSL